MQLIKTRAVLLRQLTVVVALGGAAVAGAQPAYQEPVRNVVQLSASGSVEVDQDWLQMTLAASQDGADAASVQRKLQQTVDAALLQLRPQVQGQDLQVHSGSFGVYPRYGTDSKIKGWQGRAEVVLEGRDFALISQAAAQVQGMAVAHMGFNLSKEGQAKVQEQAQAQAIENFKQRATTLAKQFGFQGYTLREVQVSSQDGVPMFRMQRANAMVAGAKMDAVAESMPVEAGKTQVQVQVSGSVQLH